MNQINPFIYNKPVQGKDFFNREKILNNILNEIILSKSQGSVWITGERQVGKTSILHYIEKTYSGSDKPISLYNLQIECTPYFIYSNVQDCENSEQFYELLYQGMKNTFDFKLTKDNVPYKNFINAIQYLLKEKIYIVFLIDEFDAFLQRYFSGKYQEAEIFIARLNKLIEWSDNTHNTVFGVIITANEDLVDIFKEHKIQGSGLRIERIDFNWFGKAQVFELAHLYLKDNAITFDKQEIEFCYKITQGYPYFTQKLFSILYERKKSPGTEKDLLKSIHSEYANAFTTTIKSWGGEKMPGRTFNKLKELIGKMKLEEQVGSLLFGIISGYLKQIGLL